MSYPLPDFSNESVLKGIEKLSCYRLDVESEKADAEVRGKWPVLLTYVMKRKVSGGHSMNGALRMYLVIGAFTNIETSEMGGSRRTEPNNPPK